MATEFLTTMFGYYMAMLSNGNQIFWMPLIFGVPLILPI